MKVEPTDPFVVVAEIKELVDTMKQQGREMPRHIIFSTGKKDILNLCRLIKEISGFYPNECISGTGEENTGFLREEDKDLQMVFKRCLLYLKRSRNLRGRRILWKEYKDRVGVYPSREEDLI